MKEDPDSELGKHTATSTPIDSAQGATKKRRVNNLSEPSSELNSKEEQEEKAIAYPPVLFQETPFDWDAALDRLNNNSCSIVDFVNIIFRSLICCSTIKKKLNIQNLQCFFDTHYGNAKGDKDLRIRRDFYLLMRKLYPDMEVSSGEASFLSDLTYLANQENARAQYYLAGIYFDGDLGVAVDDAKGLHFLMLAAKQGNARAQYDLARVFSGGLRGITRDPDKAFYLNFLSAINGEDLAQEDICGIIQIVPNTTAPDIKRMNEELLSESIIQSQILLGRFNIPAMQDGIIASDIDRNLLGKIKNYLDLIHGLYQSKHFILTRTENSGGFGCDNKHVKVHLIDGETYITVGAHKIKIADELCAAFLTVNSFTKMTHYQETVKYLRAAFIGVQVNPTVPDKQDTLDSSNELAAAASSSEVLLLDAGLGMPDAIAERSSATNKAVADLQSLVNSLDTLVEQTIAYIKNGGTTHATLQYAPWLDDFS